MLFEFASFPACSGSAQATFCAHRGFKNDDKISTQCLFDAMSSRRNVFFNTRTSEPLPACAHSPHHLRTYSGTVLRNLPSVQGFVSAQVLQRALTAAPRRSNVHSGTLAHKPQTSTTTRPLVIESIHRTVLRYTFLSFSPFSSAFPLQMHELLAFPNEPIFLPHLSPGNPPPSSLSLPPPFCPYSHEDRKP